MVSKAFLSVTIFVQSLLFWRYLLSQECSVLPVHGVLGIVAAK